MRCDSTMENRVAVLRLRGVADDWELPGFGTRLEMCLASAGGRAVLDVSEVPWLSSTMIGILITEQHHAAAMGGGIVLAGLRPAARKSLALLGVDRVLRSAPTVAEAVAALSR